MCKCVLPDTQICIHLCVYIYSKGLPKKKMLNQLLSAKKEFSWCFNSYCDSNIINLKQFLACCNPIKLVTFIVGLHFLCRMRVCVANKWPFFVRIMFVLETM